MMCVCFTFYFETISNLQKKWQEQYKEFSYTIHPETSSFMDCLSQWKRVKLKELVPQSYLTLCEPTVCSPPGSSVQGILQARILEWVAIPFSRSSPWPKDRTWVSCIAGGFFTTWTTREAQMNIVWKYKPHLLPSTFHQNHSALQHITCFLCNTLNVGIFYS